MANRSFAEDMAYVIGCTGKALAKFELPMILPKNFAETTVAVLSLSQRAVNVLGRNHVVTLGDLMDRFNDIIKFRNCGQGTAKEIKNTFLAYWYSELTSEEVVSFWEEFLEVNGMAA